MTRPFLEVIACSVADAVAAEAGGADRIELISRYDVGGLTPELSLVREVLAAVSIPVRVMLRDREEFRVSDAGEIARLGDKAQALAGMADSGNLEGLVLGFLRDPGPELDLELLEAILARAPKLKATLHRASEELPDPGTALDAVAGLAQIDTFLTSGGPEPWAAKVGRLGEWQRRAAPRTILVGGGVDFAAIGALRRDPHLRAFHVGVAAREGNRLDGVVLSSKVRAIVQILAG